VRQANVRYAGYNVGAASGSSRRSGGVGGQEVGASVPGLQEAPGVTPSAQQQREQQQRPQRQPLPVLRRGTRTRDRSSKMSIYHWVNGSDSDGGDDSDDDEDDGDRREDSEEDSDISSLLSTSSPDDKRSLRQKQQQEEKEGRVITLKKTRATGAAARRSECR
ncbi:unnamed protein product, partial [Pylaiella littoralis]